MKTKLVKINSDRIQPKDLKEASQILQNGGLVAFPTETVYGLGADGLNEDAAEKIYEAKGRPSDNPLIIHIAAMESLGRLAKEVPATALSLAERFWPGPLTMILKKSEEVPYGATGGLDTVAVRMPSHPLALALIRDSGVMIAAPSANLSGRPSPTKASHVIEDLDGRIDMILDGGPVGIGIESTIVDLTGNQPVILRPGYITKKMLMEVVGTVETDPALLKKPAADIRPKAPGMKYRHYAPKGEVTIYEGDRNAVIPTINEEIKKALAEGKKAGIIASAENEKAYPAGIVKVVGSREDELSISRGLYRILREFDALGVQVIASESFSSGEFSEAIMNRLLKAASYQVVHCKDGTCLKNQDGGFYEQ